MAINNTFSVSRLGLLLRQNLYHNFKLLILGAIGFSGAVFLLLLLIQTAEGFNRAEMDVFYGIFGTVFIIGAVVSSGTAFPYFRTKEKSIAYLLLPVSTAEKFVAEFLFRVVLFSLAIPTLFWLVYTVETSIVSMLATNYVVQTSDLSGISVPSDVSNQMTWYIFTGSMFFSIYMIPFMGSTIFNKAPLIKTLFALAVIVFFNAFLIYFIAEVLGLSNYMPNDTVLFMRDGDDALTVATWTSVLLNVGMTAVAYFKLKEKEA
jgi:hypothetical protein